MNTKHTPKPWFASSGDFVRPAGGGIVAKVSGDTDAQAAANARLIAAAPELFDVLCRIVNAGGAIEPGTILNDARAAIAKAKGEA